MEKHLTQRKTIFGDDEKNILRLVQNAIKENELDIVGSFDTHSIAKKRNKKIGRVKDHIECLRNKGFEAVQSQLPFTGIKTNASFDEFLECFEDEE
jgi:tRNA G26 N,N-dimethylase Trm1